MVFSREIEPAADNAFIKSYIRVHTTNSSWNKNKKILSDFRLIVWKFFTSADQNINRCWSDPPDLINTLFLKKRKGRSHNFGRRYLFRYQSQFHAKYRNTFPFHELIYRKRRRTSICLQYRKAFFFNYKFIDIFCCCFHYFAQ